MAFGSFKIQTNVPLPAKGMLPRSGPSKYPFRLLDEVGKSFYVEGGEDEQVRVIAAARGYRNRHNVPLTWLRDEGGVRIWHGEGGGKTSRRKAG